MSIFKKLLEKLGLLYPAPEPSIAVLIDAENIGPRVAEYALEQASRIGSVRMARVYGDWTEVNPPGYVALADTYGIQRCQVDKRRTKRNSVGIALTSDAAYLAGRGKVDTFIIVTGDQDYIPLIHSLKAAGCTVIGVGGAQAALDLRPACHQFFVANQSVVFQRPLAKPSPALS